MEIRHLKLRDGSDATIFPIKGGEYIPNVIVNHMRELFNLEIDGGQTYPFDTHFDDDEFRTYWTGKFCAVMIAGHQNQLPEHINSQDFFGTYYVKPNYVGRCSHVCNAGFLVNHDTRGKGVGRALGESYVEWAPQLGYTYSVFNLVFETNTASKKIWDALGFQRIGRVPGVAKLKGVPGVTDAIIYGKQLVSDEVLSGVHSEAN